jgi:hypothetical protein
MAAKGLLAAGVAGGEGPLEVHASGCYHFVDFFAKSRENKLLF